MISYNMLETTDPFILETFRTFEDTAQNCEYSFQTSDLLRPALERAREIDDKDAERKIIWEMELFRFDTRTEIGKPGEKRRFHPCYSMTNNDGTVINLPEVNDFKEDSIDYFKQRVEETDNDVLKAQYSDFIWEMTKASHYGQIAVDCYLNLIDDSYSKGWFFKIHDAFDRAVYLASINVVNKTKFDEIRKKILNCLEKMVRDKRHRYCLEILGVFTKIKRKNSSENEYQRALKACEQCVDYFKGQQDFSMVEMFLEKEQLLHSIYKKPELSRKAKEDRAQAHVDKAKFFAERNNLMVAGWEYENAINIYQELGDKEKIRIYKTKMLETNKESIKEMHKLSCEVELPREEVNRISGTIVSMESLDKAIIFLSRFDGLLSNYQQMVKWTEELKKSNPLQFSVSQKVMDSDGHLVSGEDDPFQITLKRYSILDISFKSILLDGIFEGLKKEKGLNKETLCAFLRDWGLIDENNLKIIECGLENHFSGDYVSSMHILVPQLEAVIRSFLKKAGVQAISFVRGTTNTQESTLSELLNRDEVKEVLKEDLHWYITLILIEKLGLNFRNDVAHGLIKFDKLTLSNSNLLLHIFILLTRFKIDSF